MRQPVPVGGGSLPHLRISGIGAVTPRLTGGKDAYIVAAESPLQLRLSLPGDFGFWAGFAASRKEGTHGHGPGGAEVRPIPY